MNSKLNIYNFKSLIIYLLLISDCLWGANTISDSLFSIPKEQYKNYEHFLKEIPDGSPESLRYSLPAEFWKRKDAHLAKGLFLKVYTQFHNSDSMANLGFKVL